MTDAIVAKDKHVQFTYQITDETGDVVERIDLPMNCIFGRHNRLYESVELAMLGASVGDEVSAQLKSAECAWGDSDPALIFTDSLYNVPAEYRYVGAEVQFQNDKNEVKSFIVSKIEGNTITIDGNHPFAGKAMTFHVKILAVRKARGEELVEGVPSGADEMGLAGQGGTLH